MRPSIFLLACALTACGTVDVETATARAPIIGGTVDTGDPEVFHLIIQGNNGMGAGCTATLIDRRTLLTAAHCVDPRTIMATSVQIFAHNKPNQSQASFNDFFRLVETRMEPRWTGQGSHDIAVALLDRAPNVTPKPWNTASLAGKTNQPIRAIGYGANVGGAMPSGAGIKRQAALTFRAIFTDIFFLGDGASKGVCHGDSGGPSFHTFSDGVERVVGVHSFTTDQTCLTGADARVDSYQAFVRQWLTEKEAPTCDEDGRCAMNCAQPDIDCVCRSDGQCTTACPDLLKDPDCPRDCVSNGVCTTLACPARDPDCIAEGMPCANELQCAGRRCVADEQHLDPYCTVTCTSNAQCWAGSECDVAQSRCRFPYLPVTKLGDRCLKGQTFCEEFSSCTGPSAEDTTCTWPCPAHETCQPGATCESGIDGLYCHVPRPPIISPAIGTVEGTAAACSSASGVLPLLALLLLRRAQRSRRGV